MKTPFQRPLIAFFAFPLIRTVAFVQQSSTRSSLPTWIFAEKIDPAVDNVGQVTIDETSAKRDALKQEIKKLSGKTERGFKATQTDRSQLKKMILELAALNPTSEPAQAYYEEALSSSENAVSLRGKWTLIYTDAPDITSLDSPINPLVELGRIGQECNPPTIANVIEWKAPEWACNNPLIPIIGPKTILQKVVTKGKASADKPASVQLDIAGLKVEAAPGSSESDGFLAKCLKENPITLEGPLQAPFGAFELLYLDEQMRITRTNQGYFAVNRKILTEEDEWF